MSTMAARATGLAFGLVAVVAAEAADVYLNASDAAGITSFNTGFNWSDGQAPSLANDYWVGGEVETVLRTPESGATPLTFGGLSLTVTNNGMLRYKGVNATITINNFTIDGGTFHNGNDSNTWTLAGGLIIGPQGATSWPESAARTIIVTGPVTGSGGLFHRGTGLTVLLADNAFAGGIYITSGTVRVGNGGTTGTPGPGAIVVNGQIQFNRSDNLVVGNFISGTGTLVKNSAGELTLTANNAYAGTTTINAGRLVLGADDVVGTGTLDLRNNGTGIRAIDAAARTVTNALSISANITFGTDTTGDLVFSGPINNGGGTKQLTISNAVTRFSRFTNTGWVIVNGPGILRLLPDADIPNSTNITVSAGGFFDATAPNGFTNRANKTFGGAGSVMGDFTANGTLVPGAFMSAGTLTFSNNVSLAGATMVVDLAASGDVGGGTNDLLHVSGNLEAAALNTVNLSPQSSFAPSYVLIEYGGTLTGDASNFTIGNAADFRQSFAIDTATAGQVRLLLTGGTTGSNLTWSGGLGSAWDLRSTANWNGNTEFFYPTDAVRFDDTGANTVAELYGTLVPSAIQVDSSLEYTFQGAGKISGAGALVKTGSGVLFVRTTNDYYGGTWISNGIFRVGSVGALGGGAGGTTVAGTGTLDINGFAMHTRPGGYVIRGEGFNSTGAVINTGAAQQNAVRNLTLAGDATIAAWGNRWDIRSPGYGIDELNLNGYTLTKRGAGQNSIVQQTMTNAGTLEVTEGNVTFTRCFVDGAGSINMSPGTILGFENNSTGWFSKAVSVTSATVRLIGNAITMGGPVGLHGTDGFVDVPANQTLTWSNTVYGAGSWTKIGPGTLTLSGSNECSGSIVVSNGTLRILGPGAGTSPITVQSNAVLSGTGGVQSVSWDPGGAMNLESTNLTLSGSLFLTGESGSYIVNLPAGFSTNLWYTWTLVRASGGIVGFDAGRFVVNGAGAGYTAVSVNDPDNPTEIVVAYGPSAPVTLTLGGIAHTQGTNVVQAGSSGSATVVLEKTPDIGAPDWQPVSTQAVNTSAAFYDPAPTNGAGFYRLRQQ